MLYRNRLMHALTIGAVLFASLLQSACDSDKAEKQSQQAAQWSQFISEHTAGTISKKEKIRIRFVNNIVTPDKVGADASDVLQLDPEIPGRLVFHSRNEIVLSPEKELPSGQQYEAVLKARELDGMSAAPGNYEFSFQVIPQDFEINISGLNASPSNDKELILNGTLETADVELAEKIEKIVQASYLGSEKKIEWQHDAAGKKHRFSIKGLQRQAQNSKLKLSWNGEAIGVNNKGEHEEEIPAKGVFKVNRVRTVQADRNYVVVEFSDKLNQRQNLKGLVRLGSGKLTTRIEGNTLKIYPEESLEGEVKLVLEKGIRNAKGARLNSRIEKEVAFSSVKPQIRFVGSGVILPEHTVLAVPFEAVNVDSVQVTAFRVYENNIGQFLQTNKLDGNTELERVGRFLWRKTIHLKDVRADVWGRHNLDVTKLLKANPGGLFRLTLSINRGNSIYSCTEADNQVEVHKEDVLVNNEDLNVSQASGWDGIESYYEGDSYSYNWRDRSNPCKDDYYSYGEGVKVSRNFMASNIGIIAKQDQKGQISLVTTEISSAKALSGVELEIRNFQDQVMASSSSDKDGFARLQIKDVPFYVVARKDGQVGYLKMNQATALPVSHFDVGGEKLKKGIKGYIYGERGVWRPGDDIYLTFVLQDKDELIPANHPVTLRLYSPKGQLVQTITNNTPVGDFYSFKLKTADDAVTGNWTVKAQLGGSVFSKTLKIETVVPNRLKVKLDFGTELLHQDEMPIQVNLDSEWLHGAKASGLKAEVEVKMTPRATGFNRFTDYIFDDPAREFSSESEHIFEGHLDPNGHTAFSSSLSVENQSPGMLNASFITRVYEQGGAFSSDRITVPYSPYPNYLGIKLPKGDATRGMLLTDIKHQVSIASLNARGEPVPLQNIEVQIFKIDWKWWWDKSGESLARYASAYHPTALQKGHITTDQDGKGEWEFEIKYPDWGRYLVRACDLDGNHCTGKTVYIDWPGWAGRAQEDGGAGASVLNFFSDKQRYSVGETARIQLPEATQGRALVSIESGNKILRQMWHEFGPGRSAIELPITADMAPNVYVDITLVQPHAGKNNDRPIRVYGVIPLLVDDPATRLQPVLKAADEWEPEGKVEFSVSEEQGHAMTYTVAVVDEGLLGLTRFKTPDLHDRFYRKEALGVQTWDMYNDVVGTYGGELERLLALGGSDSGEEKDSSSKKRFPPVVKFFGPFRLEAGKSKSHNFEMPQYIGAVRVMLVAGERGAYGHADKSVFVRKPLAILATLPRVAGPDEELSVPVALFSMEPSIKEVTLKIETDEHFQVVGSGSQKLQFQGPGDKLGVLQLKSLNRLGKGRIHLLATSGKYKAETTVYLDVRTTNPLTSRVSSHTLAAGESWEQQVVPHGLPGTNRLLLEVSAVPPVNLGERLNYLIRYPHGCIEQVTSSVFPQLYLGQLMKLDEKQQKRVEHHINAAIERLRQFQTSEGGFTYWPGSGEPHPWGSNYAGHFLLEAKRLGYAVPAEMLNNWLDYQGEKASTWLTGSGSSELDQAYRLYTLALAKQADIGAMNRMREASELNPISRWQLAAAYQLAGQSGAASQLVEGMDLQVEEYPHARYTLGSTLRDQALILNTLVTLGREEQAGQLVQTISSELSSGNWYSTQSVAYSLLAMSHYIVNKDGEQFKYSHQLGEGKIEQHASKKAIQQSELPALPAAGELVKVKSFSKRPLYVQLISEGAPPAGSEVASAHEMSLSVEYYNRDGKLIDVSRLAQGSDIMAVLKVRNDSEADMDNIALTHIVPAGWEIHNPRFDAEQGSGNAEMDYQDIRDDRIYTYFSLQSGAEKEFTVLLNAAYLGRYYLPSISVEPMYDASRHARTRGQWVEVIKPRN